MACALDAQTGGHMQQGPHGYPPSEPTPGWSPPGRGSRSSTRVRVGMIAAIIGLGVVVIVGLILLLRSAAMRQESECAKAIDKARGSVGCPPAPANCPAGAAAPAGDIAA